MHFLATAAAFFAVAISATRCSETFIVTKKVTPAYWRATFSSPPFNIQSTSFLQDLYALVDRIEADPEVKVVVFDSSSPDFWIAHFDAQPGNVPAELTTEIFWGNISRLAHLPVLTVAAIRGICRGGGAEFSAALDVSFASKERAVFAQPEVGGGESFGHARCAAGATRILR